MTPASPTINRKALRQRIELDATSWVDIVRGFATGWEPLFEELRRTLPWEQSRSIREGRMIPDPRLGASLSIRQTQSYPALHRARLILDARYRIRLGGIGLVLYRDGRDGVGFHADDEMLYLERTIVASLGLGATRTIAFKSRSSGTTQHVELVGGDLYVMGGRCQADWLHGVPKLDECGPRISAVWRWTSRQGPPSSSPSRFVPDAPRKRRPQ